MENRVNDSKIAKVKKRRNSLKAEWSQGRHFVWTSWHS